MGESEVVAQPTPKPKSLWRKVLQVAFGILLFVIVLYFAGLGAVDLQELPPVNITLLIAGGICAAGAILIFQLRWSTIVRVMVFPDVVPRSHIFAYGIYSLVAGLIFIQTLSLVVIRSLALNRRDGVKLPTAIASVIIDKLFDLLLVVAFVIPALWFISTPTALDSAAWLTLGVFVVISIFLTVFTGTWVRFALNLIQWSYNVLRSIPIAKRLAERQLVQQVVNVEAWADIGSVTVRNAYWLTIVGEIVLIARSMLIAEAVGLGHVPISAMALGVILSQVGILLAITPQGLGVVEAFWLLVMAGSGVDGEAVAIFLIVHRLTETLAIAFLGLATYVVSMIPR